MLRASVRRVKAPLAASEAAGAPGGARGRVARVGRPAALGVLLAAITLALPGCYWARYPELMETHVGLLLEFAGKLEGLASDGERVPAQDWGEFTYPLERARDFARIAAQRYPGRASLAAFDRVLERYAALVASPDVLERPNADADVAAQVVLLREEAARTRAALEAEAS